MNVQRRTFHSFALDIVHGRATAARECISRRECWFAHFSAVDELNRSHACVRPRCRSRACCSNLLVAIPTRYSKTGKNKDDHDGKADVNQAHRIATPWRGVASTCVTAAVCSGLAHTLLIANGIVRGGYLQPPCTTNPLERGSEAQEDGAAGGILCRIESVGDFDDVL